MDQVLKKEKKCFLLGMLKLSLEFLWIRIQGMEQLGFATTKVFTKKSLFLPDLQNA